MEGEKPVSAEMRAMADAIRGEALRLGFARAGFCDVDLPDEAGDALQGWLRAGYHGEMRYMERHGRRVDARYLMATARTLITVVLPYPAPRAIRGATMRSKAEAKAEASAKAETEAKTEASAKAETEANNGVESSISSHGEAAETDEPRGFVAHYARGPDYHQVLRVKLEALGEACAALLGRPVSYRACVDSAPLLERAAAEGAGQGFIGKSTLLITPGVGTYTLLGELLIDIPLPADAPMGSRCGDCTACLKACPTDAFVGPYLLDARRCISYLTIEHEGPLPVQLRPKMGLMVFGCDICQEVCPWNASPKPRPVCAELLPRAALTAPRLFALLNLTSSGYRRLVAGTALRRVRRAQLSRNAAVALGNTGDPRVVPGLVSALQEHPIPLVRAHVAWALGRFEVALAVDTLRHAAKTDGDHDVRQECESALRKRGRRGGC